MDNSTAVAIVVGDCHDQDPRTRKWDVRAILQHVRTQYAGADLPDRGDLVEMAYRVVVTAASVDALMGAMLGTGTRSEVRESAPRREGNGTSRMWQREMRGKLYSFHAVTMPDGERRYHASRWDGPGRPGTPGNPNFAHHWTPVFSYTVPVYHVTQSERFPRLWNVHTYREWLGGKFDTGWIYREGDTFKATRGSEGSEGTPDGQDQDLGSADTLDGALALFKTPWH